MQLSINRLSQVGRLHGVTITSQTAYKIIVLYVDKTSNFHIGMFYEIS